ncbi:hypothetical protein [Vagococcus zengguangii]|uniref:Uncharacterized protein n=1 Tax=Vagococcus zengguangii TaxID=2571750 RepID=A0A4D7CN13_9ENTE|nr:hypothetical protein [Vagococcus zengguangii]QCI85499.1 hypothetical protein FA707_00300 [Vagococcus zengguangii]TLG80044.1 hypothetical protein FE258_06855 [Vagococcus zengguangii]
MNKKSFLILLLSAIFALGSIVIGVKYSKDQTEKLTANLVGETISTEKNKTNEKQTKTTNENTDNKLSAEDLYLNDKHVYLAKKISDKKISEVKKVVKDSEEQLMLVENAKTKWAALKEVNNLFNDNVLKGDKVTEASFKDETNETDIERVRNIIEETLSDDAFKTTLLAILSGEEVSVAVETNEQTDSESVAIEPGTDEAYAESLVAVLVGEEGVRPSMEFTYEDYTNASAVVDGLAEGEAKDYLRAQLARVLEAYPWLQ